MDTLYNSKELLDYDVISNLSKIYGNAFYVLHKEQFMNNFRELKKAFQFYYPKFNISFKTSIS